MSTGTDGSTEIWATIKDAPVPVKALLVGVFVNKLGWFLQVFLVLFLTTSKGFTDVQAGTALGIYGAGSVLGLIIGGSLSDKVGPRAAVMISMFGMAAFVLAIAYVPSYPAVVVVVALAGAVGQFYRPASAALLTELTPKNRQVMIFAVYRLAMNLGTTAAPLIGAALVAVSWNLLFIGEALAALAYAVVAIVALPKRRPSETAEVQDTVAGETPAANGGGYLAVLRDYKYVLFLLCMFINAAIYMQYLAVLPLHMKADGLSTWWFSAVVALNGFIVITCELLVTKVVQNWPARTVAMIGFVLLGGGLAFYALPGGIAIFVIGTLLWTLAEIIGGPTMFAYPGMAAPKPLLGRYVGSAHAMFGLGSALGPFLGVWAWNSVGTQVWVWCGLAGAVGIALAYFGMSRAAASDEEPAVDITPAAEPLPSESS
ncbi:putative MFS family arabinose efflux permease [Kribbella amoyensis]|uniref:Putative MFS family arabinose efflux permease n=1 Tax=Kribbella amoyensis TaxID=996641 RepID=A0A561BXF9_9ACTN|nr:MFS transporter [Kribbella amoyensis]TWD83531.1 putative MFS family arabinose efflux permease [Kribbella amoyensis]